MLGVAQPHSRGLVILTAVAAIALSACSGGSATAAPTATATAPSTIAPAATASPAGTGGPVLAGAADAMASLTSYKFRMTQAGTDSVNQLPDLTGNAASTDGSVTFTGMVILKPDKAAEVTTTGLHVINVGGFDYMDVGNAGSFAKIAADTSSISDAFTPATVYKTIRVNGYSNIGSETKNGVPCDHYQAGVNALAELGSVSGVKNATWSADLWIAQQGGYPVAIAVIAKAKDGSIPYETIFDLTNVNDPANKVTAPDNVMGA